MPIDDDQQEEPKHRSDDDRVDSTLQEEEKQEEMQELTDESHDEVTSNIGLVDEEIVAVKEKEDSKLKSCNQDIRPTPPRQEEQEHESSWIPPTPNRQTGVRSTEKRQGSGQNSRQDGTGDVSSEIPMQTRLLESQSAPGAFRVGGISQTSPRQEDVQGQDDEGQSTETSVLAMVPPRYMGDNLSGRPTNSSAFGPYYNTADADLEELNSLVPVDSTPDSPRPGNLLQNGVAHSMEVSALHGATLVEAQVVSDHSMTMEERVNAEVESRLQHRLNAITTAEVIGTDGRVSLSTTGLPEQFTMTSHSPSLQQVSIDEEVKSANATNGSSIMFNLSNLADGTGYDRNNQSRKKVCYLFILVLFLVAIGGSLMGIFLGRGKGNDTLSPYSTTNPSSTIIPFPPPMPSEGLVSPTALPSPESLLPTQSPRYLDMQQALTNITRLEVLKDPSSSQHSALLWMVYDDGLQLNPVPSYDLYQRYILATLYFSTQGSRWKNQCRFLSATSVCDWQNPNVGTGVFCGNETSLVEKIQLKNNGLRGSIPFEIVFLESVGSLSLFDNDIVGSIPRHFNSLKKLRYLDIERNLFSNTIPSELSSMTQLEIFIANSNRFTGSIPDLTLLTKLVHISLGDNRLSGLQGFPGDTNVGIVPALERIQFPLNRLRGSVDTQICNLLNLKELSVYGNELTAIPECLNNLQNLETVYIHQNSITGTVDPMFCPLKEKQVIEADCFNEVQCSCCTSCCDSPDNECLARTEAPSIDPEISVSSLPTRPPQLTEVPSSPIDNNEPSAPPIVLSPSQILVQRYEAVRDVLLQVSTEESLDDVSSAQYATMEWIVELDEAQISPEEEGTLITRYIVSLLHFTMNGDQWWNQFGFLGSANICNWNDSGNNGCYCLTDGTRDILFEVALFENNLRGQLPDEIFFLKDLQILHLNGNAITGSLSSLIGSFNRLRALTFDFNLISGPIPTEIGELSLLEVLWLNDNMLENSIPSEIGRLSKLRELSLESNSLTGTVPLDLQNLENWETIYLENNSLRGNLDPIFCPLKGPNLDLWSDCGFGLEIDCSCCTFCCYVVLGCFEK